MNAFPAELNVACIAPAKAFMTPNTVWPSASGRHLQSPCLCWNNRVPEIPEGPYRAVETQLGKHANHIKPNEGLGEERVGHIGSLENGSYGSLLNAT